MISPLSFDTIASVELGRSDAKGDRALLKTVSLTLRSRGRTPARTAADSDEVDLNTREIVTEHNLWVEFKSLAIVFLKIAFAQTEQQYNIVGRKTVL